MKKTVKSLIIAASVAAIAGIGAVSFAAWSAGTDNTKTVPSNTLGEVSVLKFGEGEGTLAKVEDLLPIDQGTGKTYQAVTFKVVTSDGYDKSDFKLKVELSDATTVSETNYYATTTEPTKAEGADAIAAVAGDKIDATNGKTLTFTLGADGATYTLYIYHDSADMSDMNKTFTLKYTLEDGTTDVSGS